MAIYKGDDVYGVSTIDVTLGFFNRLVKEMEQKVNGTILIVEADGKIAGSSALADGKAELKICQTLPVVCRWPQRHSGYWRR